MTSNKFSKMDEDEEPIVSTFRRIGLGFREIAVMILVLALAVICIILAALLSIEKAKSKDSASGARSSALFGSNSQVCLDPACLKIASHSLEYMNTTTDPCEDFYKYACGNFGSTHKVDMVNGLHSTLTDLETENEKKVESLLLKPIERYSESSSERKLKELYHSCMDDLTKERQKGKPLIEKIIPKMKGWYVFGNWKQEDFDLNQVLKTVQTDLFTSALFSPYPGFDNEDSTKKMIQIYAGGISYNMPYFSYLNLGESKEQKDYETFVGRVARLLLRDANIDITPEVTKRIDQFAADVFHIESKIVENDFNFMQGEYPGGKVISLGDLTNHTGSLIDWTVQIGSVFNKMVITKDTLVYVDNMEYMMQIMQYIDSLDKTDMPRILHNYLTWRIIERFLPDLSSEYMYADREIYDDLNGRTTYEPRSDFCLHSTVGTFPDAMGALYIADHFFERNKNHVIDITSSMKNTFNEFISKNTWMDQETKKTATDKVESMKILIGYPPYLSDHETLDTMYEWYRINSSDYFENVLNSMQAHRRHWNDFMTSIDPKKWYFNVYSSDAGYFYVLNQATIPAGMLQFPVYEYNLPHYVSFGAIGSLTGRAILFAIDVQGREYDVNGKTLNDSDSGFWSAVTADAFNTTVQTCMADFAANVTQGPFTGSDDAVHYVPFSDTIIRAMITNAAAVRYSFEAYMEWKKQGKAREQRPLATSLNDEQMFFMSYAQTFCETYNDVKGYEMAKSYGVKNIRVNLELQQLDEFSQAYQCPPGSKMNPTNKCPLY